MDESPKPAQSGSWLKWFIVVALLLVLLAVVLWSLPNSSSKVQARIDALKKAGYPITAQDLDKMYPPLPDDQNSVIIYQKAFSHYLPLPPWDEYIVHDAKTHAQLLLSETALGIERYRVANHDQLPAMLQDLVPAYLPAVPTDPFDGKLLRYNRLPKGYLLYSISEDGVDNGGKEWDPEKKTGDLTFTVER
jgi:hypothetical protein